MTWQRLLAHVPPWADPILPPDLDTRPKVIGIGFHKTGTTSLGRALRTLGYRLHKGFAFNKPGKPVVISEPVTLEKVRDIAMPMMHRYSAFDDNPWPLLFADIDQAWPASKFVLTIREPEAWYRSAANGFGDRPSTKLDLIYGEQNFSMPHNKNKAIARYNAHNQAVRDHFKDRPDDLLIWDLTKNPNWEPLCRFIGVSVPNRRFPHGKPGAFVTQPHPLLVNR
jgi:hypothetical protein